MPAIIEHLEAVVGELDSPPILIGHSAGGVFVADPARPRLRRRRRGDQLGADRGRARVVPLSQIKSTFPVLKNPANRHKAVGFTHEQWHYAFTNTFSEEESRALYERYHIPASGRDLLGQRARQHPARPPGRHWVDYKNDDRAPLLFISGSEDHLMPPKVQQSNAKHYKSDTVTEVKEFEGRAHLLPAQEGWEEVADYALDWALEHAVARSEP